jgi:hypothetical protein
MRQDLGPMSLVSPGPHLQEEAAAPHALVYSTPKDSFWCKILLIKKMAAVNNFFF